jgi:hypothetical protein
MAPPVSPRQHDQWRQRRKIRAQTHDGPARRDPHSGNQGRHDREYLKSPQAIAPAVDSRADVIGLAKDGSMGKTRKSRHKTILTQHGNLQSMISSGVEKFYKKSMASHKSRMPAFYQRVPTQTESFRPHPGNKNGYIFASRFFAPHLRLSEYAWFTWTNP